jgi:hypothetical protein
VRKRTSAGANWHRSRCKSAPPLNIPDEKTYLPDGKTGDSSAPADAPKADPRRSGITWNKGADKVALTDDAKRYIAEELEAHRQSLEADDPKGPKEIRLERHEIHEGLRKCAANIVRNRAKTGPKTLPALVVNWLKTDLSTKREHARSRASPNAQRKAATDEAFRQVMQKALKEEAERGDETRGAGDSGALALFLPTRTRDPSGDSGDLR